MRRFVLLGTICYFLSRIAVLLSALDISYRELCVKLNYLVSRTNQLESRSLALFLLWFYLSPLASKTSSSVDTPSSFTTSNSVDSAAVFMSLQSCIDEIFCII